MALSPAQRVIKAPRPPVTADQPPRFTPPVDGRVAYGDSGRWCVCCESYSAKLTVWIIEGQRYNILECPHCG